MNDGLSIYQRAKNALREPDHERTIRELREHVQKLGEDLSRSNKQRIDNMRMYGAVFTQMREAFGIPDNVPFNEFGKWIQMAMATRQQAPAADRIEHKTYIAERVDE